MKSLEIKNISQQANQEENVRTQTAALVTTWRIAVKINNAITSSLERALTSLFTVSGTTAL